MKIALFKIWNWLVISSEDPEKFSARFLGLVTMFAGTIAVALAYLGHPTTPDAIILYVAQLTQAGGLIYTIFGVIRYVSNVIDKKVPLV